MSDEYGPYIYHLDHSGKMTGAIRPPPTIIPEGNVTESFNADSPPRYDPNITTTPANPITGRSNNQGLEGLTSSPDKKTLYALMQSALVQEGGLDSSTRCLARFLEYDVSDPSSPVYKAEYVVPLPLFHDNSLVAAHPKFTISAQLNFSSLPATPVVVTVKKNHCQGIAMLTYLTSPKPPISSAMGLIAQTAL